jgi:hypothetical protein
MKRSLLIIILLSLLFTMANARFGGIKFISKKKEFSKKEVVSDKNEVPCIRNNVNAKQTSIYSSIGYIIVGFFWTSILFLITFI